MWKRQFFCFWQYYLNWSKKKTKIVEFGGLRVVDILKSLENQTVQPAIKGPKHLNQKEDQRKMKWWESRTININTD